MPETTRTRDRGDGPPHEPLRPHPGTSIDHALHDLTRLASLVAGTPVAALALAEGDVAWLAYHVGLDDGEVPPANPFLAVAARHAGVFAIADAGADEDLGPSPLVQGPRAIRLVAGAGIGAHGQPLAGALLVMDAQPRSLDDGQREGLLALSRQAAILLRLEERGDRARGSAVRPVPARDSPAEAGGTAPAPPREGPRRARLWAALGSSLIGSGAPTLLAQTAPHAAQVCETAVRSLFAVPEVDHCALFLLDASGRQLESALWYGPPGGEAFEQIPLDTRAIVSAVARSGELRNSPDVRADPDYLESWPEIRSELALPLRAGGETVGVLNLESRRVAAFSPGIVSLCESVAHGISAALEGTNITELLLRAKVALEMTFDAMPHLVAILDRDGRIRRLNKSLARRIGRPLRDLIGEDLAGLFPFCAEWLTGEATLPTGPRGAIELHEPETGAVYEATMLQIQGSTALLGERVVLLLDVTQEREMARRMAAFERRAATGDLLMGVAHEVRNPLAAVQASAEALRLEVEGKADETALVDIIRQQVDRLTNLMRDLLDVARPSPSALRQRESLGVVCRAALAVWKQNPARRARQVHLHAPSGDELSVMMDHARIEQVLFNLLDNAAEHSPADCAIEVELERRVPDLVRVRTVDRGSGVAAQALGRLFEPFFTTRPNGTGLGLAIVKSIVEDHGGRTDAWNNDPPPGLTVEFTLPLAPEHDA